MRKMLLTLVAVGVLLSAMTASQALTVYIKCMDTTTYDGSGAFTSHAAQDWASPLNIYDDAGWMNSLLTPQDPHAYHAYNATPLATPTFGREQSFFWYTGAGDPTSVTFTDVEAWYALAIHTAGDATDRTWLVKGRINGTYDYDTTTGTYGGGGTWKAYELYDLNNNIAYTTTVPDPVSGIIPHLYVTMQFADGPVNLYVEVNRNIPTPQLRNEMTGVITTVPEPGAIAMLFGSGVVGSLMVWRRRRNAA